MEEEDEEELRLARASSQLLEELETALPRLLWARRNGTTSARSLIKTERLQFVVDLIEPFQSEPQLLDTRLQTFLSPIVNAYLAALSSHDSRQAPSTTYIPCTNALSRLLYVFCKVRGEKVISRFLSNEPKHLESVLSCLEHHSQYENPDWHVLYILLLWLSHLLLAPFNLAIFSSGSGPDLTDLGLEISSETPAIACRVLNVGVRCLHSVTKEAEAAAKMLVRLLGRPDMRKLNLGKSLVSWAIQQIKSVTPQSAGSSIGCLSLLARTSASLHHPADRALLLTIYNATIQLLDANNATELNSSLTTRKLIIKIYRHVGIACAGSDHLDTAKVEAVIDLFLQSLAERDTQVRFSASKSLGAIVTQLQTDLGQQVIDEVTTQLAEILSESGTSEWIDVSSRHSECHGLTLALAFCLSNRTAAPDRLPHILPILLSAIAYERRAPTGQSLASNVRDAACFALWSIARRYTTAELLSVPTFKIGEDYDKKCTIIERIAQQLIVSACLDPEGNVRRGCSAALQELVGRHPDQVVNGIPLIQIVDYQAVGLRRRAVVDVAYAAALLAPEYWTVLVQGLLDWRGISAIDATSREAAAKALGLFCVDHDCDNVLGMLSERLRSPILSAGNRHGALVAASQIVNARLAHLNELGDSQRNTFLIMRINSLMILASLLDMEQPTWTDYSTPGLRADLFTGVARFLTSLADLCLIVKDTLLPSSSIVQRLGLVTTSLVSRSDEPIMAEVPVLLRGLLRLRLRIGAGVNVDLSRLFEQLESHRHSSTLRVAGIALTLGASFPWLTTSDPSPRNVTQLLCSLQTACIIEWRVVGLRALEQIIKHSAEIKDFKVHLPALRDAIRRGLQDYTITERGDVGSLVRMQAINCVMGLWKTGHNEEDELRTEIHRLSLERLDRTRLAAATCITDSDIAGLQIRDVSSADYFEQALLPLHSVDCSTRLQKALIQGCISSAGTGSERLLRACRSGLVAVLTGIDSAAMTAFISTLGALLKEATAQGADAVPTLELLSFLLDSFDLSVAVESSFNWRNLLAAVQKSHFKSSIVPKILTAVDVYRGLAAIKTIRTEVLKKLVSMLRTNPHARVRLAVVDCLWTVTGSEDLMHVDWGRLPEQCKEPHATLACALDVV